MWEYMWGMTIAQIELLSVDKPLTLYGEKKDEPDFVEMQKSIDDWNKKHGDDGGKVDASEAFKGFI